MWGLQKEVRTLLFDIWAYAGSTESEFPANCVPELQGSQSKERCIVKEPGVQVLGMELELT